MTRLKDLSNSLIKNMGFIPISSGNELLMRLSETTKKYKHVSKPTTLRTMPTISRGVTLIYYHDENNIK